MDIACGLDLFLVATLGGFGLWLLNRHDFPYFGSKRLPRGPTATLGAAGLAGAAMVAVSAVVEGLLLILSNGIGPEARRHPDEAYQIFLFFLVFKLIVIFLLVVLYLLIGYYCAKPRPTGYDEEPECEEEPREDPDWH
jgi:hypothetical protein